MELFIDNIPVEVQEGESLLDVVRRLGLDTNELATRPLAAQLAGETFTLRYVPIRVGRSENDPRAKRRAVRAAKGRVTLLRYGDPRGQRVYERTMLFVFLLAVRNLYPEAKVHVDYAVGQGVYCSVRRIPAITAEDTAKLEAECRRIVKADYPLERQRLDIEDAIDRFAEDGQTDKVRLLEWRTFPYFDVYAYGDYEDYFYGEMAPSTDYASVFSLHHTADGVVLMRPDPADPNRAAVFSPQPLLSSGFRKSADWGELMHCSVVADLNDLVRDGKIRQLIRVNEALHEKEYARIADEIVERDARAILIAGPSSSGKTTSANRLCTQLRVHGKSPVLLSLDDYYIDRDKIPLEPDGTIDLEHIRTIDVALFGEQLTALLNGETVELPRFDFLKQRRVMDGSRTLRIDENTPLVIEGLHGLNPALLPPSVDRDRIFRLYVSALTTLNLDDHNRIQTTEIRLLRRIVRDYETRGASIEHTLSMWGSVRRGEERWIFPYQEQADAIFNSALVYEPAVLKKHIFPLLMNVRPDSPYYEEVHSIVKFLNYFLEANVEDEIPPTSVLREFIGGNTFYR